MPARAEPREADRTCAGGDRGASDALAGVRRRPDRHHDIASVALGRPRHHQRTVVALHVHAGQHHGHAAGPYRGAVPIGEPRTPAGSTAREAQPCRGPPEAAAGRRRGEGPTPSAPRLVRLGELSKNRLEAFSDGVFVIAITLLVIEIRPPTLAPGESLAHGLWDQWPSYLGYLLSFLVLGVMWLNHHRIFEPVRHVDGAVLVLNLNLLLWAVLIPFPTAVLADFLRDGGADAKTAVGLYGGVILMAAISFTALFVAITRPGIVDELPPPGVVRAARLRFSLGVGVYGVAFALSWLSPALALVMHGSMAAYYLTAQSSRLDEG